MKLFESCRNAQVQILTMPLHHYSILGQHLLTSKTAFNLNWNIRYKEYENNLLSNEHYLSCSENKAWKNSGLRGIWTLDLCDTAAMLYQLS